MTEQTKRPGETGEDDRKRTQTTPEKGPQGDRDSNQPQSREELGRGQNANPTETLGTEKDHVAQQSKTATQQQQHTGTVAGKNDTRDAASRDDAHRGAEKQDSTMGRTAGSTATKKDEDCGTSKK